MQLDEGLDTGDVLMVEPVDIDPEETSGELFDRVSAVGAKNTGHGAGKDPRRRAETQKQMTPRPRWPRR